jgi:hypothetical protein
MSRRGFSHWAAAALALVASLLCLGLGLLDRRMVDFEVNDRAARRIPLGETLYRSEDGHFQFKYPPAAALVYLPLTLLSPRSAKAAWLFVSLVAIGLSLGLSLRLAGWERGPYARAAGALALLAVGKYLMRELELGQINILILLLMLASARFLTVEKDPPGRRSEAIAGCLWGAATAVKPYTLVFLPYLILRKRYRALAAGVGVIAASLVLPGFYYGYRGSLRVLGEWVNGLSASTPPLLTSQDNVSVFACASKALGHQGAAAAALGAAAAGVLGLFVLAVILKGRSRPGGLGSSGGVVLEVALLLLLTPLVSPLGWDYTLLAGLPAVVLVLRHFGRFPKAGRVLLGLSLASTPLFLYDVVGRRAYGDLMGVCLPTLSALVLAGFLADLRRRGAC